MKRIWLIAAAIAVLALVVVASIRGRGERKKVRLTVEEAKRESITQVVKATGEVNPRVKVNISTHVIAKIARLFVKEGDTVAAGQPFLELEREAFLAARDTAAAQLAIARTEARQAEVALADADLRLVRARRLEGQGITSIEQLEAAQLQRTSAELRLRQAESAVEQARASFDKARDDLAKTTLYAPLAGQVISLNAKEGEVVVSGTMNNPASVIGTIADLAEILVEAEVDETEVVDVRPGMSASIHLEALGEQPLTGRVTEIGASGYMKPSQPDVKFFKVKLLVEKPDARLRPGMSARVEIGVATRPDALVVPIQAVVDRRPLEPNPAGGTASGSARLAKASDEIPVVFVIEGGVARQRPVQTGLSDATRVEIVDGLAPGAKVATGPYRALKKLTDGDRVTTISQQQSEKEDREAAGDGSK